MPPVAEHLLVWATDHSYYELYAQGYLVRHFQPNDEELWLSWLADQTSFAFYGRFGHLNVHKEVRKRGDRYWYAHHSAGRRNRKRYLGQTANLTLARLEQVAQELAHAQSPAQRVPSLTAVLGARRHVEQQTMPLATKLARPRLPVALIVRERLLRQLAALPAHRLTLLSAAAGWGKTTLLSAWAAQHPHPVAWVSLDAQDNNPTRFWSAVIGALHMGVPEVGATALAMLHAPQPPPLTAVLTSLLNDLTCVAAPSAPIPLILDDYHVIDDQTIHESLTFLLEHLPERACLMLASRVDPDLPLARWRVRGELLEIRATDLRFTAAEATAFFTQSLSEGLAEDDVRLLEQRTEGWVAGLQLAVLAMRQRTNRAAFVQQFTGSHRYLLDYVQEEILQRQPLPIQRFLLQTAVVPRMNAALCAALTGEPTSQAMLDWLERHNLFVAPLDDERQWYRMHDLFREVMLARLQATEPELVPRLHQRAARWYAAQGAQREAIVHALAAVDFAYAADLIEREAPHLWLRGEAHTIHAWIQALPDTVVRQHARLALNTALRLLESLHATIKARYANMLVQLEQTIARVEALVQRPEEPTAALPDAEVVLICRRIRLLRALIAAQAALARGDLEHMRLLAQETEELAKQEELDWQLIALWITYWLTETLQRQGGLLLDRLLLTKQQALAAGDHLSASRVMRWLTLAYGRARRLHMVYQESVDALALMEQNGEYSAMEGYLHYMLADCYYAWNRLEEASSALQRMLRIAHTWQQADLLIVGTLFVVSISLANNDLAAAEEALQTAEELAQQERDAYHPPLVVVERVQYWLAAGNLQAVRAWAEQAVFTPETWSHTRASEFLMLIRVYLALGQYAEACAALDRFSPFLDRPGDELTTSSFLALQAIALYRGGECKQARTVVLRLIALTEPESSIRVYLDAGEPMQHLLQELLDPQYDQENSLPQAAVASISKLLAAFAQQNKRTPSSRSRASYPPQPPALTEPLTQREQEVLHLLAAGASNREIAAQLVISLATVKKHVSNLLGKLNAESRTQAIAHARERSLLV
jgi:LuxR family maltose regulon positive regulatory protein